MISIARVAPALAVALLAIAAVLGPVAIGCTGEWARFALEATMTAAVGLWAIGTRRSTRAVLWPVVVAGLVLLQLMPLPDNVLEAIAPVSVGAWKVALEGVPGAWGRISIDPAATAMAGRRLLLGLATIAAVAEVARVAENRRRLIGAIALSGIVIVTLALVFPVSKERHALLGFFSLDGPLEYWRNPTVGPGESSGWGFLEWKTAGRQRYLVDLRVVGDGFGSYIVSNHFAGAVSLTLPVVLAAWLFLSGGRLPAVVRYVVAAAAVAGGLWLVGPKALSRAGFASLLLAGLSLFAMSLQRPWARRAAGAAVVCYAAALLLFVVVFLGRIPGVAELLPESVRPRVTATLSDGRVLAAGVAARMFRASPLLGTGLSTYDDHYPRFMRDVQTMYYAHNDYAQLLAETGLVGLAAAVALAAVLLIRLRRFLRESVPPPRLLDAGPWAALAGIAAHSAFDWNLHVPANAFLACLVAGLAAASGAPPVGVPVSSAERRSWPWLDVAARIALVASCCGALLFLARDARSSHVVKQMQMALVANEKAANNPQQPAPDLALALDAGRAALRWDPGNPRLALLLGQVSLQAAERAAAAKRPTEADADPLRTEADAWFARARRRCAVCRGLPEPAPAPARK